MTEEEGKKIWIPPETTDSNTQRMAWLLFLEWWKAYLSPTYKANFEDDWDAAENYRLCLKNAKIVRRMEQE